MKSILQKRSFVSNRTETLSIKNFINAPKVDRIKKPATNAKLRSLNSNPINEEFRLLTARSIHSNSAADPKPNNQHSFVPISKGTSCSQSLNEKNRSVTAQSAIVPNPTNQRNFAPVKKDNSRPQSSGKKFRPVTAYSIYFNPAAFFDPTFILIGAGVLAVAILEKKLAENGYTSIASTISSILRIALPGVALLSIIYLISHSSFLL